MNFKDRLITAVGLVEDHSEKSASIRCEFQSRDGSPPITLNVLASEGAQCSDIFEELRLHEEAMWRNLAYEELAFGVINIVAVFLPLLVLIGLLSLKPRLTSNQ
jgi:hypothetical protein